MFLSDNLGCAEDVLPILDKICSGRQECSYVVGNSGMIKSNPCQRLMLSYMEATYDCVQGNKVVRDYNYNIEKLYLG